MKIGTFSCWLWGHKFLFKEKDWLNPTTEVTTIKQMKYCTRCGIDKNTEAK